MFSKKEKYILRDKLYKSIYIKGKFKCKLQKSLILNSSSTQHKKLYLNLKLNKAPVKLKKKNLCLISGENNTIKKHFLTSRFVLNRLSICGGLQNFKINTW
jgi:hypothetical protein